MGVSGEVYRLGGKARDRSGPPVVGVSKDGKWEEPGVKRGQHQSLLDHVRPGNFLEKISEGDSGLPKIGGG